MRVVFVVDSINELNSKINTLNSRFGSNILYVVKADILNLFKTYNHQENAVYYNNLPRVIHSLLSRCEIDDTIVYYSSLDLDNEMLNSFIQKIGDKTKIVNVVPNYNKFEQMCNRAYNIYVKTLFNAKDSLISPKLQFLPAQFVNELLHTHFGNRLFEANPLLVKNLYIEDKEKNEKLKIKTKFNPNSLISIIVALIITSGLVLSLAFIGAKFAVVLLFILLYLADIIFTIILQCKALFDKRFFK